MAVSATKEYQRQKNRESYRRHKEARIKAVRATPNRKRLDRESYERNKEKRIAKVLEREAEKPEMVKATQKWWYQEHKAERLTKQKAYEEDNIEKVKETTKRYEEKPETRAKHRKWEHEHPEKVKAKWSRQYHAKGTYTKDQLEARIDFYGRRCYLCHCDWDALVSGNRTIDHIIPLSKGGTNWPSNLAPACRSCNASKSNKARTRTKKTA